MLVEALSSIDDWLAYSIQFTTPPAMRTPYADSAISKAKSLKDVLVSSIYRIVATHYDSLQRCDFSNKRCDKLQLFTDFKY